MLLPTAVVILFPNADGIRMLRRPVRGSGGFQDLLRRFKAGLNWRTGAVTLTAEDWARTARYARRYGEGGFENRLRALLGERLS